MPELPEGRVGHLTNGRLRVRIPDRRGDAAFFEQVAQQLRGWDSIEQVEVNPLTGSVLVHFTDLAALYAENALKNDRFLVNFDELLAAQEEPGSCTEWAGKRVAAFDSALRRWTGGTTDIRNAMFVFLVAGAAVQLVRGNIAAPAATLLWYAGAILRLWDVVPPPKEAVGEG